MPLQRLNRFKRSLINRWPFKIRIHFPKGLHSFNHLQEFILVGNQEEFPFLWLESIEDQKISFVVIDPFFVSPKYSPFISKKDITFLEGTDATLILLGIVNPKKKPFTLNLAAPLLINWNAKKGKQILTPEDTSYEFELN